MSQSKSQRKKVAVVTGASAGIGCEITKELARNGYMVYACARRLEPMEQLTFQFGSDSVKPYKLDISKPEEIVTFAGFLRTTLPDGKLDLLYNNAGQSCTFAAMDATDAVIEQCFKVNVFGHVNMCRELSQFLVNSRGTIVFTGSLAGVVSFPFGSIYSASKAAIHQYARGLHLEMKPFGVRVINAITGGVATDIADKRPLPENSIYNFPEGRDAFNSRKTMAKDNKPMPAEAYAKQLVQDILSSRDPVDVYRGTFATIMRFVMILVPYWLLEKGLSRKFKLDKVNSALKLKQKNKGD
ncbi:Ayr1p [Saccharomyces cerevisiae x Saccharomyces kudriavzevii VIN7]|uniref:Ayr1p n=1 Tax=Saccharomyces cerevisiae x Saccharomyces kudriavzevii (strain VIN7) TaxID=1095631 RepID=H0GW64_SACCK|nr:Ayr1p [Saccharomyces cerevisiae x Saccharomyces kudriavzevii VIN7]